LGHTLRLADQDPAVRINCEALGIVLLAQDRIEHGKGIHPPPIVLEDLHPAIADGRFVFSSEPPPFQDIKPVTGAESNVAQLQKTARFGPGATDFDVAAFARAAFGSDTQGESR
jgi:hypothetical protein